MIGINGYILMGTKSGCPVLNHFTKIFETMSKPTPPGVARGCLTSLIYVGESRGRTPWAPSSYGGERKIPLVNGKFWASDSFSQQQLSEMNSVYHRGKVRTKEAGGYPVRSLAIFDPTGTPTSSATGLHFAAIR
jgi:hypothetical protein